MFLLVPALAIISFAVGYSVTNVVVNQKYLKKETERSIQEQLKQELEFIQKMYWEDSDTIIVLDKDGNELHRYNNKD